MKARILIWAPQSGQVNGSASQILAMSPRHWAEVGRTIRLMALSRVFRLAPRARAGKPLSGMCWVTAAMKSVSESAAKLPPCFLFMRER